MATAVMPGPVMGDIQPVDAVTNSVEAAVMVDHEYPEYEDINDEHLTIVDEDVLPGNVPDGFWTPERIEQWWEHMDASKQVLPGLLPPAGQ